MESAIKKANEDSAAGSDNIQAKAINKAILILLPHLLPLFNEMWEVSFTPTKWQEAITKLLHKKGSTIDISNYRPITLLQSLFKIWERILNTRLTNLLEMTDGISPLQTGSRRGYSAHWTILARKALI